MSAVGFTVAVEEVVVGSTVQMSAGPFNDAAGQPINLTTWTHTLHLRPLCDPTARTQQGTVVGTADGYLTYSTQADEIDETDQWVARFETTDGTTKRYSTLGRFNVSPVLP